MPADQLSATFAALADPTRRAILARLVTGECSVTELAEPFEMSMPAVSKHLRVLQDAGLIVRRHDAQFRHCQIEAAPLKEAAAWVEAYRHIWDSRHNRLDTYLRTMTLDRLGSPRVYRGEKAKHTTTSREKPHARKPRRR
jgi:DNA-binding transcriptional ArsR family regulator